MSRTSSNGLIGLFAITGVFTAGLHQMGSIPGLAVDWSDPIAWLEASQSEDAVGGVVRSIGLVVGYWILGSATLYVASGLQRRRRRPRWVALITHRWIRRIADRALAVTLTASIVASPINPALAEVPAAPIVFEAETDGIPVPHVRMDMKDKPSDRIDDLEQSIKDAPAVVDPVTRAQPLLTPVPITAPMTSAGVGQSQNHTVVHGDNLWTIAARHLENAQGSSPDGPTITEYWLKVITANSDTLRSGDPNLIFPGEIVALPAVADTP